MRHRCENSSSATLKKKREKRIWSGTTQNSHESHNLKNAITFESMNFSFTCSSTPLQYNTYTLQCVYISSLGGVQTVHLLQDLSTTVCWHRMLAPYTYMTENIMFSHYIMIRALVALGEFSHRTPHMLYPELYFLAKVEIGIHQIFMNKNL